MVETTRSLGVSLPDVTTMTSRPKLSAIVLLVLLATLSILFYIQSQFQVGKVLVVDNFRPREPQPKPLHLREQQNATSDDVLSVAYRLINQSAPLPTKDLMVINGEVQKERHRIIHTACKKYRKQGTGDIASKIQGNIFVDHKYKVVYCSVPKIACTSWKKVFLVLNKSFKTTAAISQYYANRDGQRMLTKLRDLPPSEVNRILATYTKFMFSRHPFSRILSAFKNKLAPDSTFERADMWKKRIGTRILTKYRQDVHRGLDEYDLTFEEFVNFLAEDTFPYMKSKNKHWSRIYDQCLPCDIDYDVIGKFETLSSDAEYILNRINADGVTFPGANSSSPTDSSNQTKLENYYSKVPLVDIHKLYERFKADFDIFGYEPPTLAFKGS